MICSVKAEEKPLFSTAMDDYDNVRALNTEEWETRKQEYIKIAEEHLKTCKYKSANIYLNRQKPFWGK